MRAVQFDKWGPPSVLHLRTDYPKPTCAVGEVLIRIHAASINPADIAIRSGGFFPLLAKKPKVLGCDFAGVVEDAKRSAKFKPGDKVIAMTNGGNCRNTTGAYAEYIALPADDVAMMPPNLSFEEAAGVPLTALTAWQALDKVKLESGQRLLVQAGSGGVGSWIVQLAKIQGLHVTATCSTPSVTFVKQELGADVVIDYTQQSLLDACKGARFDGVIDCVGGKAESESYACLRRRGTFVEILNPGMSTATLISHLFRSMVGLGPRYDVVFAAPNGAQLQKVADLLTSGKAKAHVDQVFPLSEATKATEYFESRKGGRGKVVLKIQD
ncbi:hypothetical protein WJX77_000264 [Trebouxia sp. C0004]